MSYELRANFMLNIILIGYRCSGKTAVGKSLAKKTGRPFVDTDEMLMKKSGRTVEEIVQKDGWEVFRKMERDTIRVVCQRNRQVIATGGGAVLDPENVRVMKKSGKVVWLKATPETIRMRMTRDEETDALRPALTEKGLYDEISDVLRARVSSYESAMDFSIDTNHRRIVEIVDEIIRIADFTGEG